MGEPFTRSEMARYQVATDYVGQLVTKTNDNIRNEIKQTVLSGIRDRRSKGQVSQDLFNRLGAMNRDWKRIADTEIVNTSNLAGILEDVNNAPEGEKVYFKRYELPGCCDKCARINGKVVLWSNAPLADDHIKDEHADIAIWEGKPQDKRMTTVVPGTMHPNCRGGWVRWGGKSADAMGAKIRGKIDAWDRAVKKAREEYREKGVENPNDQTEWYKDRINELYKHFSKTSGNIDRKKIESYIDTLLSRCAPMPKKMKTVGGYGFTAAQLEILGEIADGELAAIGKVMSGGLYGGKLEQALFNSCGSLNRDWHFLAALHGKNKNTEEEKRVMREYFLYDNGRFETEEEVHQFFDSSEYLKLRPRLKKEMVEDALYWINGGSNEKN
jgi:hypothetical protein